MKLKELLIKLIEHYKSIVLLYSETGNYELLKLNHVDIGVCKCSHRIFGAYVYGSEWLTKVSPRTYWYRTSSPYDTVKDNVLCLEYRMERMQEILQGKYDINLEQEV